MSGKLQTLEEWARNKYERPPSKWTLRRWVADGKIFPIPQKQGRAYFVDPNARYVGDYNSAAFTGGMNGSAAT